MEGEKEKKIKSRGEGLFSGEEVKEADQIGRLNSFGKKGGALK